MVLWITLTARDPLPKGQRATPGRETLPNPLGQHRVSNILLAQGHIVLWLTLSAADTPPIAQHPTPVRETSANSSDINGLATFSLTIKTVFAILSPNHDDQTQKRRKP